MNIRTYLNTKTNLFLSVALLVMLCGCLTTTKGCNDDVGQAEASTTKKDFDVVSYGLGRPVVIYDHARLCEYVVINSSVFVWRGTNLLAYTVANQQ